MGRASCQQHRASACDLGCCARRRLYSRPSARLRIRDIQATLLAALCDNDYAQTILARIGDLATDALASLTLFPMVLTTVHP